jgi:ferritin-like metal-binding protein YciE
LKKPGREAQEVQCPAIDGLLAEGDDVAGEIVDKQVLDAAIVGAADGVQFHQGRQVAR